MFDEELKVHIRNALHNILQEKFPTMTIKITDPTGIGMEASIRFTISNDKGKYHGLIYLHSFVRIYESSIIEDIIENIENHFHIKEEVKQE